MCIFYKASHSGSYAFGHLEIPEDELCTLFKVNGCDRFCPDCDFYTEDESEREEVIQKYKEWERTILISSLAKEEEPIPF